MLKSHPREKTTDVEAAGSDEESFGGRRDQSKTKKFKAMLKDGSLPEHVAEAWEKTLSLKTGKAAKQRDLVNKAFVKKGGKLALNLQDPFFESLRDTTFVFRCYTFEFFVH